MDRVNLPKYDWGVKWRTMIGIGFGWMLGNGSAYTIGIKWRARTYNLPGATKKWRYKGIK
jgi:hypothetical protein